jgi:transposase-like protein
LLKGIQGRGTLETEKLPTFGIIERGGGLVIRRLANVKQATIKPIITATVAQGNLIYTDEYDIYARLEQWRYARQNVCHSVRAYARDDDRDGPCKVNVNVIEGVFWEFVHNVRKRGKALVKEPVRDAIQLSLQNRDRAFIKVIQEC